ncbi:hypothetical protein VOLCADRAFT_72524 [Volvox carteri f. nagariensis]|uniref:Uncharacterized protein n=1 Tax=Volvox carteri f. nagariensis TaxID=3068 RepID=D8TIF3_VOLCA|nr:uncharacterized protein VOLCADRAFT_72524 [Volvox carteri f. nagariensis]EFJ52881.1 hypothetical protein VOLCADRAFT_72524 [Volvox carteri f. nagariensis]|eukprot:XP_002945886.1 hypothetical protein VOLCADRAFT_72524 [Volvox carteri f. nagariensis]
MQAWCRFFRSIAGRVPPVRKLHSQARSVATEPLSSQRPLSNQSLASLPCTSGRDIISWGFGFAACSPSVRTFAAENEHLVQASALHGTHRGVTASLAPGLGNLLLAPGSVWNSLVGQVRWCQKGQLSRQRVPKGAAINDNIMPNTTQLKYGLYGIRALAGKRVAANTLEAVRRTLRRKLKKTARLWVRIEATVPVTRKPLNIRMGKGKGAIAFYATAVRPGQIIYEMDRVPRTVALQAMQAAQYKFPVKLGFVEWS